MNRRKFLQSVAALVSIPALPKLAMPVATGAAPMTATVVSEVPAKARFWAIYMSHLHGECRPEALQTMLQIPAGEAKSYVTKLVAEGVIKPNPLAKAAKLAKSNDQNFVEKVKQHLEKKTNARVKTEQPKTDGQVANSYKEENETSYLEERMEAIETEAGDNHEPQDVQDLASAKNETSGDLEECQTCIDPALCACNLEPRSLEASYNKFHS